MNKRLPSPTAGLHIFNVLKSDLNHGVNANQMDTHQAQRQSLCNVPALPLLWLVLWREKLHGWGKDFFCPTCVCNFYGTSP